MIDAVRIHSPVSISAIHDTKLPMPAPTPATIATQPIQVGSAFVPRTATPVATIVEQQTDEQRDERQIVVDQVQRLRRARGERHRLVVENRRRTGADAVCSRHDDRAGEATRASAFAPVPAAGSS